MKNLERLIAKLDVAIDNGEITETEAREILRDYERDEYYDIHNHA